MRHHAGKFPISAMHPGLLPAATHPRPDELLSSWLVRLARDHYMKVYTFGKLIFPGVSLWNRDVDKAAPDFVLATLGRRTLTQPARIQATTLRQYEGRLYLQHNSLGNTPWLLPLGIYHRTRRRYGQLFCPGCLKRDGDVPYFRTLWRLALSVVCLKCCIYLHDQCPQCQQPVIFFRAELGRKSALADAPISHCFNCGFDLAMAPKTIALPHVIATQREWYRILNEGWKAEVTYPHLYFAVLRQLVQILSSDKSNCISLQRALFLQDDVSLPRIESKKLRGIRSFEQFPLDVRCSLLQQAQWLLTNWPMRFVSFMKLNRIPSTPLLQDMIEAPFWYYSIVKENFHMSNVNRRFDKFWL
jgi:hypothetical protein